MKNDSNLPDREQMIKQTLFKAGLHEYASKVGIPHNLRNLQSCPCCDNPIQKIPIPLTQHIKEFQIFGFGYSLWFSFLKYCIFLIFILIASKTAFQLYQATKQNYAFCYSSINQHQNQISKSQDTQIQQHQKYSHLHSRHFQLKKKKSSSHSLNNFQPDEKKQQSNFQTDVEPNTHSDQFQQEHHEIKCTSFMVYFSLFKSQFYYTGSFIAIIQFLSHLIALIAIRNMIQKQEQYYDERTTSLSDYSLIISQLPKVTGNRKRLQKLLEKQFSMTCGKENSKIQEIIYMFKDENLEQMQKKKKKLEDQILKGIDEANHSQFKQAQTTLELLKAGEANYAAVSREKIKQDLIPCQKMIIVFNSEHDKAQVLKASKQKNRSQFYFQEYFQQATEQESDNKSVLFKQAPEPNQLIWQNLELSEAERNFLALKGYGLTFIFLAFITIVFYFILLAKTNLFLSAIQMKSHSVNHQKSRIFSIFAQIIVFLAIFGVVVFNKFVLGNVLHKIVHSEKHVFVDKQNHSFALKYSLCMFFTTALMTLAVQAVTFRNFYTHQYGVIEQETIMFFVTAFLIPLIWLIHPYNICKKMKFSRHKDTLISQQKANFLSENVAYDSGKRHAQIFEIMWFTFLYSDLIPLGSFLILIGLVLYYWVDKYNFLRKSVLKSGMSGKMAILALKSLDATLFLPPIGSILFDIILRARFSILDLVLAICGILYLFVPISKIIWYFNSEKFFLEEKKYQEIKYQFKETYVTEHPVYKVAFQNRVNQHRQRYSENLVDQYKISKMYGTGRGAYKSENYTEK